MANRGAVCMGNPLVRFWEGQEYNWSMEEILWHRRESRRQTEKTNFFLSSGSLLSTHKVCLSNRAIVHLLDPLSRQNKTIFRACYSFATRLRIFSFN